MKLQVFKMEQRDTCKNALKKCLTYEDFKYIWSLIPTRFMDEEMSRFITETGMVYRDFCKDTLATCFSSDIVKYVWSIIPAKFLDEEMYILGIKTTMDGMLLGCVPEEKRTFEMCQVAVGLDFEAFRFASQDVLKGRSLF